MQVKFCVDQKSSFKEQGKQFPLTLCWAVTIHKCQGLTLDQTVVDMSPAKRTLQSRPKLMLLLAESEHSKIHTYSIIHESKFVYHTVSLEMNRLRTNPVP